jgi:hypothetical protein
MCGAHADTCIQACVPGLRHAGPTIRTETMNSPVRTCLSEAVPEDRSVAYSWPPSLMRGPRPWLDARQQAAPAMTAPPVLDACIHAECGRSTSLPERGNSED